MNTMSGSNPSRKFRLPRPMLGLKLPDRIRTGDPKSKSAGAMTLLGMKPEDTQKSYAKLRSSHKKKEVATIQMSFWLASAYMIAKMLGASLALKRLLTDAGICVRAQVANAVANFQKWQQSKSFVKCSSALVSTLTKHAAVTFAVVVVES